MKRASQIFCDFHLTQQLSLVRNVLSFPYFKNLLMNEIE